MAKAAIKKDDYGMPRVTAYPKCSECGAAFVLRLCFQFGSTLTHDWLWQRDCKHKKAEPEVVKD